MRKTATYFPLILLASLFLLSCRLLGGGLKDQQGGSDSQRAAVATKKVLSKKQGSDRTLQRREEIASRLEERAFLAALEKIRQEVAGGTPEKDLAGEYLRALNGAIEEGQAQLKEDNPGQAGLLFRAVLDSFPKDSELVSQVTLPPPELEEMIELCANKLMEKGLGFYRAGKLNDAIKVWKQALAFQPQNQAIRNAIQTTDTQLKNLKSITDDE